MNTKKYPNLKSWQPGQSGNPAGRKPGSKNVSTIVQELLDQDADINILATSGVAQMTKNSSTTYAKAIVLAMLNKALHGNLQAAIWLTEQQEKYSVREVETREPVVVSRIKPRNISTVE